MIDFDITFDNLCEHDFLKSNFDVELVTHETQQRDTNAQAQYDPTLPIPLFFNPYFTIALQNLSSGESDDMMQGFVQAEFTPQIIGVSSFTPMISDNLNRGKAVGNEEEDVALELQDLSPKELKDAQGTLKRRFNSCPNLHKPARHLIPLAPAHNSFERNLQKWHSYMDTTAAIRSISSCPEISALQYAALHGLSKVEADKRLQKLEKSRHKAKQRRERQKTGVELCEQDFQLLSCNVKILKGFKWGENCDDFRKALGVDQQEDCTKKCTVISTEDRKTLITEQAKKLAEHSTELELGLTELTVLSTLPKYATLAQHLEKSTADTADAQIFNLMPENTEEFTEMLVVQKLLRCVTTNLSSKSDFSLSSDFENAFASIVGEKAMSKLSNWLTNNSDSIFDANEESFPESFNSTSEIQFDGSIFDKALV